MNKPFMLLWALLFMAMNNRSAFAQIKYRIGLDADKQTYRVYMTSTSSYTGNAGRLSTAQVTILAPHGAGSSQFTITNLQGKVVGSQSMIWSQNARVNAPTENPTVDYISFGFTGSASPILFDIVANQEIELFSFKNEGSCLGAVTLFDNVTDPFRIPNSQNTNPGNQMAVLGHGPGNAYVGNYGTVANCYTTVPDLTATITGPSALTAGNPGIYTILVTNVGTGSTNGITTITTGIPAGLSYTGSSGAGWGCSVGIRSGETTPVSCTTNAVLPASASSGINLSLVSSLTTAQTLTIAGAVSGGGETNITNDAFSQNVSIQPAPGVADLSATIAGPGSLASAMPGTLTLTVGNVGTSSYSGTTITQTLLPNGLTYVGTTGTGWSCGTTSQPGGTLVSCTTTQSVAANGSLPPIYIASMGSQTATVQLPVSGTVTGAPTDNTVNNTYTTSLTILGVPTVGVSSPTNNGTTTPTPVVSGTATPGSQVTITGPGNIILCTTMASASGTYSCAVTVSMGPSSITAVACNAGGCSSPAISNFTVVGPPSLTVAQPQPGPTTQPVSGTATPGSQVVITGPGNITLCTATASVSGTFTCSVTVNPGVTPVTVTACNNVGCTSQPVMVTTTTGGNTADLSTATNLSNKAPNQFEAVTATVVVTNNGPNSATGVVDRITLPAGQPVTALSASAGTFNQTTGLWTIGTLAVGQSVTLTVVLSAATGGVAAIQSEIVASGQHDPDSTPNNQQYGEDDLAVACFSVPVDLCQGETFTFSIPGSFTSVQWYRNGQPIAQATTNSLVISQEGTYAVSTNVNCPSGGCCPLIVRMRPAGSCCQPARCVPFVITKRTR